MKTPAQLKGFIENVTHLKLTIENNHPENQTRLVWMLVTDDKTSCPYFTAVCGTFERMCYHVDDMTIIEAKPIVPVVVDGVFYSPIQKQAIDTFTTMYNRAVAFRQTGDSNNDLFYTGYGICDNIERCSVTNASKMAMIKDNIIRRLPSYSGNYHYPVKHPVPSEGESASVAAERAWGEFPNKWANEYGANRLAQLAELLDYIKTQWVEELSQNMTAAKRVGIIVGVTIVQHLTSGELYTLQYDDGSSDPYFVPVGKGEDTRRSIELSKLRIMKSEMGVKRSVSSFIKTIDKTIAKRKIIEAKLAALQVLIDGYKQDEFMLDYELGKQHGVKRLTK